jgi:hypothetical protein
MLLDHVHMALGSTAGILEHSMECAKQAKDEIAGSTLEETIALLTERVQASMDWLASKEDASSE